MAAGTRLESTIDAASCDTCLSPSIGWLSPRISFSKDVADGAEKIETIKNGKEKSDRDSMSEFEFAMSAMLENEAATASHMLAADELFFKGKLLPLYVPQYLHGSDEHANKGERKEVEFELKGHRSLEKVVPVLIHNNPITANNGMYVPTSPKKPTCSTKLRELLGLKKVKPQGFQDTCKRTQAKVVTGLPLNKPALASRAKRLFCRSVEGKVLDARNSSAEPLLACREGGQQKTSSVQNLQPRSSHHKFELHTNSCSAAPKAIGRKITNTAGDAEEGGGLYPRANKVLAEHRASLSTRGVGHEDVLRLESYYRGRKGRKLGGSGDTSPGRRSSGALSPAGSSGHWSPGRHSLSGWSSPGRGSTGAYSPGRLSLGETMEGGWLLRARSLERSSSYSPKSLQRKYDQLRAMRQREGWRILERSSSYNMNSVRVAPVLNVPLVCITRSKNTSGSCASNNNGSLGIGQLLFSLKTNRENKGDSRKANHLKATGNMVQPKANSKRPPSKRH